MTRVFISYRRQAESDEAVATYIHKELKRQYDVFIDREISVGERWAERIRVELSRSDFLIPFLSAESVHSEMVLGEIELANDLCKKQGHPVILPVRLAYEEPFTYPLSAYLNPINWVLWNGPEDLPALLAELRKAISGEVLSIAAESQSQVFQVGASSGIPVPLAAAQPPPRLEPPGGTMDPHSDFYLN